MKRILALLLCALLACTAASCSPDKTESAAANTTSATETPVETNAPAAQIFGATDDIKAALSGLAEMDFGGVLYAEKDGKTVASYANGTLSDTTAITLDTPLPVGSVSKQFCAAAIMLLQEQGKLSVQDTLDKYFPEYAQGAGITLHNLLSMRSGIVNFDENTPTNIISMNSTDSENTDAILKWLFAQPLRFEPDEKFEYSNFNYLLLGNIVEQASGERYEDFLRGHFFSPLGMSHTGFTDEIPGAPAWAKGFSCEANELTPGIEPGAAKGAGDIISNAADMTKWLNALPSGKVISQESWRAMTTDYTGSATHYGYGLYLEFADGVGHFGNIGHFNSADFLKEDAHFTLFMVTNNASSSSLTNQFFTLAGTLVNE